MIKMGMSSILLCSTALVAMAPMPLMAEEAEVLEEVVVTAARRSQALSEVPSNLMAYGAEILESRGVENFSDLSRVVPGLAMANFDMTRGGWGGALPIMRGVNANRLASIAPNVSAPTISTYYGNTLLPVALNLADIERLEVLRGPQGTLYGSGSMAGVLQMIPASPDLEETFLKVKGDISTTHSSGEVNYGLEGIFNWAVTDGFGVRVLAGRSHKGGFIDQNRLIALNGLNKGVRGPEYSEVGIPVGTLPSDPETYTSQKDVNDAETDYFRAKVLMLPTEWLSLELTYDRQQFKSESPSVDNPQFDGFNDYEGTVRLITPAERNLELVSLDVEADFGFATLAVNVSDYSDKVDSMSDWTAVARTYVGQFYFAPYAFPEPPRLQGTSFEFSDGDGYTIESILTSNGDNRFNWMAGIFHTVQKQKFQNEFWLAGITEYSQAIGNFWPYGPLLFGNLPNVPDDLVWEFNRDTKFKEISGFIDVDYDITDRWEIAAGIRFFKQTFTANAESLLFSCNLFCSDDGVDPRGRNSASSSESFEDHVIRLSTNYRVTDDLRVYFNFAEGFRRGGANAVPLVGLFAEPANLLTFEPDKVKSYELGLRGDYDGFSFTADVYYMDWDGAQIEGLTPSGNWYAVVNANSARNIGFDFEANVSLSDNISVNLGYAYVDAKLSEDFSVPAAIRPAEGVDGDRLPGVPEHSLTGSLDWIQPEVFDGWDGNFNVNLSYRSNVWTDLESKNVTRPNSSTTLDGYAIVNASYSIDNGNARITLYINNIFSERGVGAIRPVRWSGDTINASYGEFVTRPRTIGLRSSYSF